VNRLALALFLGLSGCRQAPVAPKVDPGACFAVCANYRTLKCPAGDPTPDGATCETVCASAATSGLMTMNLACRATAASCDEASRCESQ
jgi:hypothetical protein